MDKKTCTKCNQEKQINEFEKDNRRPTGYGSRCQKCATAIHKTYVKPVYGKTQPRKKSIASTLRQDQIVKYGISIVEALDGFKESNEEAEYYAELNRGYAQDRI